VVDGLGEISTLLDWGTCVAGCTPWVTVSQSGCNNGNWCLPMLFNADAGECKGDLGNLNEYDACTEASSCGVGMLCVGLTSGDSLMGYCRRLCDPDASPNQSGDTCAADEFCDIIESEAFSGYTVELDVGICTPEG
jgi:hypothetical protein